jgi:hypothetical protein
MTGCQGQTEVYKGKILPQRIENIPDKDIIPEGAEGIGEREYDAEAFNPRMFIGKWNLRETEGDAAAGEQPSGYYVYATPNGTYYHVNSTCSGMQNAQQVLLSDMLKENRPACPKCCPNAESTVFAEKGNPYYHSYATCSGMTHATQGILVNALVAGLTRCPECWTADGQAAVSDGP